MSDDFEHLPGCAHVQNMARPRSQRLIGPRCECRGALQKMKEFQEWCESDEGKKTIQEACLRAMGEINDT